MPRKNIQPDTLFKRAVSGRTLYSPVVVVKGGTLVLVSGLLARDRDGNIIGKGDMGAQIGRASCRERVWIPV